MHIENELIRCMAEVLATDAERISPTANLAELGLDSLLGLRFAGKASAAVGREIELEWLYDYPTLGELARFLAAQDASAAVQSSH